MEWVHAHEEDTAAERVFRPLGHPFPPSLARVAFALRHDGTLVERGPGPRNARGEGRWRLEADGSLALEPSGAAAVVAAGRLRVLREEPDRLVLGR